VARGIFPAEIAELNSTDDTWRQYLEGETAMAHVSAHRYLSNGDRALSSAVAPIPAISGPAAAIGRGWALALVTADPVRQSAAVEFLTQLMAPETNAAWNQAQGYLPTRQSALSYWKGDESYVPFMEQQLRVAQARPPIPQYARTAAALQQGVADVVSGSATPEEAASQVIEQAQ
jgi:ABC-type glycerol-3-phosphate transport system substrate-binding protein